MTETTHEIDRRHKTRLTLQQAAKSNGVRRIAIVKDCVIRPLLHRCSREGNTLYVPDEQTAYLAREIWPAATLWGDFTDGTGIPLPIP